MPLVSTSENGNGNGGKGKKGGKNQNKGFDTAASGPFMMTGEGKINVGSGGGGGFGLPRPNGPYAGSGGNAARKSVGAAFGVDESDAPVVHLGELSTQISQIRAFTAPEASNEKDIKSGSGSDAKRYEAVSQQYSDLLKLKFSAAQFGNGSTAADVFGSKTSAQPAPILGRAALNDKERVTAIQHVTINCPCATHRANPNQRGHSSVVNQLFSPDEPLRIPLSGVVLASGSLANSLRNYAGLPETVYILPMNIHICNFQTNARGLFSAAIEGVFNKTLSDMGPLNCKGQRASASDAKIMEILAVIYDSADANTYSDDTVKMDAQWRAEIMAAAPADGPLLTDEAIEEQMLKKRDAYRKVQQEKIAAMTVKSNTERAFQRYRTTLTTADVAEIWAKALQAKPVSNDSKIVHGRGLIDGTYAAATRMATPLCPKANSPQLWTVIYRPVSNLPSVTVFYESLFGNHAQRLSGKLQEFIHDSLPQYQLYYGNDMTSLFEKLLVTHYRESNLGNRNWCDFHLPLPLSPQTNNAYTFYYMRRFIFTLAEMMIGPPLSASATADEKAAYQALVMMMVINSIDPSTQSVIIKNGLQAAVDLHKSIQNTASRDRKVLPLCYANNEPSMYVSLTSTSSHPPIDQCSCDIYFSFTVKISAGVVSHEVFTNDVA